MGRLNQTLKIPEMARMLANFQKEMAKMDDKQELMEDMLDDVFQEDGEERETEQLIDQIIDEACGVSAPGRVQQAQAQSQGVNENIG